MRAGPMLSGTGLVKVEKLDLDPAAGGRLNQCLTRCAGKLAPAVHVETLLIVSELIPQVELKVLGC